MLEAAEEAAGGAEGGEGSDEGVGVVEERKEEEVVEEAACIDQDSAGSTASPICSSAEDSAEDDAPKRSGRMRKPSSTQSRFECDLDSHYHSKMGAHFDREQLPLALVVSYIKVTETVDYTWIIRRFCTTGSESIFSIILADTIFSRNISYSAF